MAGRYGLVLILAALILGGVIVLLGHVEQGVDFSAALEIWGDVLRDVDQVGFKLTRVSNQEEVRLGKEIASQVRIRWRENEEWESYVSSVGQTLLPHIQRKGIHYEFHVVESSRVNAFAMPGGQIFVTVGMLEFLQSEAELAGVLAHEIAHVDLRHCIEGYQYVLATKRVGAGEVGHLAESFRRLLAIGYKKYQELDADAYGVRLMIEAGYDPQAMAVALHRLRQQFDKGGRPQAKTPVGEFTQALEQAIVSYPRSHPTSEERIQRVERIVSRNRHHLSGRVLYVGAENYRKRIPRSLEDLPSERRGF